VGSAVFPTLLLLNHSCEPNTLRINTNGNQVLMVAKRRIAKGEEITDNYGIHHLR
jgi:SET domain-containing protein